MRASRQAIAGAVIAGILALLAWGAAGCGRDDDGADEVAAPIRVSQPSARPSGLAEPAAEPEEPAEPEPSPEAAVEETEPPAPTERPTEPTEEDVPVELTGDVPDEPAEVAETIVTGTITLVSKVPEPGTAPYRECLTYLKYSVDSVESGEYEERELLAVFWGMRDNKLEPAASFEEGQRHRLTIVPFDDKPDLTRIMAADDTDEYELVAYWVESYE
jgi:hypothetical protein